jgi:hypothetical protein
MDFFLPPRVDHYAFDRSQITAEVREEKRREHPHPPEGFSTWSLPLPTSLKALSAQPWFDLLRARVRAVLAFSVV